MKISHGQIQSVFKAYAQQPAGRKSIKDKKGSPAAREDQVVLSREAREMRLAMETVARASEVREDKVREIKTALSTGNYEVSGEQIAEKMLGRTLVEKLL